MRPTRFFLALLAAATLVLAACGGDSSSTSSSSSRSSTSSTTSTSTSTTAPTDSSETTAPRVDSTGDTNVFVVTNGSVDGPDRVEASVGATVKVRVTSDVSDEVHVHGVDDTFDLQAGTPLEFDFVANVPGVFEVELESSHTLLFELAVR